MANEKTEKTEAAPAPKKTVKRVIIKLGQQYGINMPGEVCGFTPDVAKHILEHDKKAVLVKEIDVVPHGPGNIRELAALKVAALVDSGTAAEVAAAVKATK